MTLADNDKKETIQGYLRLGICVSGPNDQQTKLDVPIIEKTEGMVLMPPLVTIDYYQLIFRFYSGQCFPDLDLTGGSDPFIHTSYMGIDASTSVKSTNTGSTEWNEELWIPMKKPTLGGKVIFEVIDHDPTFNDYIGSMTFNVSNIDKRKDKLTGWINLYGATPNSSKSYYKRFYDQNPEEASAWNGRVLCQLEGMESKNPIQKLCLTTNGLAYEVLESKRMKKFYVNINIGMGICLPEKCDDLSVEVKICEHSFKTKDPPQRFGRCYLWNWKSAVDQTIELPYNHIKEMADIFIYVRKGNKYPSFKRLKAADYFNKGVQKMEWMALEENLSDGSLDKRENCGIISMSIDISDTPRPADEQKKLTKIVKTKQMVYDVFVHIFQCKDLPAGDTEGTSDTYISLFTMADEAIKTKIAYGTLNPVILDLR